MKQIYEGADHVLVLDAQLSSLEMASIDHVEICTRLMFSGWTRRLWTLQEGTLARKLWVQLKDGPVDLDDVQAYVTHVFKTQHIHHALTVILAARLKRLRGLPWNRPNIMNMKLAIEDRSVTVASDEALCLCTCLNLDQSAVVHAEDPDRMVAFWTALGASGLPIPKHAIFFTGPRYTYRVYDALNWPMVGLLCCRVIPRFLTKRSLTTRTQSEPVI